MALVAGGAIAYPLAKSETLSRLASPFIATTQAMPMIALAPLLVMWFGLGLSSKVIICALIVFFRSWSARWSACDRSTANCWKPRAAWVPAPGRHCGTWSCRWRCGRALGGVRLGLTLAMTGAIVGEFVASDAGLGFLMVLSRTNFDASMVFAAALTMAAISTLMYKFVGWLDQALITW